MLFGVTVAMRYAENKRTLEPQTLAIRYAENRRTLWPQTVRTRAEVFYQYF